MAASTLGSTNPSPSLNFFAFEGNPPRRAREASFSSYLTAADDKSFSLRFNGEFTDTSAASVRVSLGNGRKKETAAQDEELDIFPAEKYFNGGIDGHEVVTKPEKPGLTSFPSKEVKFADQKFRSDAPVPYSEASGQSRSALVKDTREGPALNSRKLEPPAGRKKFLGLFHCSCSGKSSVAVNKIANGLDGRNLASCRDATKQVRPAFWYSEETGWRRTVRKDCFAFQPTLYPIDAASLAVSGKMLEGKGTAGESSTDVYGAPFMGNESGSGLRSSLTTMAPFPGGAAGGTDDDGSSESSSELFEIDSISNSTLQFGTGGGTSAATTLSAPSEKSINWSVVTASAANLSVVSDVERSPPPEARKVAGGRHQRPGGGLLLGCGSGKAVSILSNIRKAPDTMDAAEPRRNRSMAVMPVIRYHPESPRSVDLKAGQPRGVLGAAHLMPTNKSYLW